MNIANAHMYRYALPLKQPLHLRGQQMKQRHGLLLKLTSDTGHVGWGEAAPLPGFSTETLADATHALVDVAKAIKGRSVPFDESTSLEAASSHSSVCFALESAVQGMCAAEAGELLHAFLKPGSPDTIQLNALLTGAEEDILEKAGTVGGSGYQAVKLKVGQAPVKDAIALVHQVRQCLGDMVKLRLDANRAWPLQEALSFVEAVHPCDIEYIEEPVRNPLELPAFFAQSAVPYAVDETVQEVARLLGGGASGLGLETISGAFYRIIRDAAAVVWKPTLLYFSGLPRFFADGIIPAQQIVLSGAFESGVGTSVMAHLAAAYSRGVPVGLDTYGFLGDDVLDRRLPLNQGQVSLAEMDLSAYTVRKDRLELVFESSVKDV